MAQLMATDTPNSTGEFSAPGVRGRPAPGAVACFAEKIWLIGCGNSAGQMWQSTLALQTEGSDNTPETIKLLSGDASNPGFWSTSRLSVSGVPGGQPLTFARCGAAPVGSALYLVWNHVPMFAAHGTLMASAYTEGGQGALTWSTAVALQDASGNPLQATGTNIPSGFDGLGLTANADVSVTAFGPDSILVACPSVTYTAASKALSVYVGVFTVSDINQQEQTWKARDEAWVTPDQLRQPLPEIKSTGLRISVDWFQAGASPAEPPTFGVWVSLTPDGLSPAGTSASILLPLVLDASDQPALGAFSGSASDVYGGGLGGCVTRDPAGRLCTYASDDKQKTIDVRAFNTSVSLMGEGGAVPIPPVTSTMAAHSADGLPPSVVYFTDLSQAKDASVTVPGGQSQQIRGLQYPVYEFVFYNASDVKCQVSLYGYAQVFSPYLTLGTTPRDSQSPPVVIAGFVDAPIPVPSVNFADYAFQDSEHDFGDITYSATSTTSVSHSVSSSMTAGIMSDGRADKGFGPAWNIAINGGSGYTNGTTSTTTVTDPMIKPSLIDTNSQRPNQQLIPAGTAFCSEVQFIVSAYRFVGPDGESIISDGTNANAAHQAPLFSTIIASFTTQAASQSFVPYSVTPGDLASYTAEAWNARMQQVGYTGANYVQDVIQPNAYVFATGQNCLSVGWSSDGRTGASFQATSGEITEQSWTFSASVYAGVSGGEGASIFGMGEDETFELLAGGTYNTSTIASTSDQQAWGISLSDEFGPPSSSDPAGISAYTFDIYFLPPPGPESGFPSTYWAHELKRALSKTWPPPSGLPFDPLDPSRIDLNASPWKICYVVTSYQSNDGKTMYPPGSRTR